MPVVTIVRNSTVKMNGNTHTREQIEKANRLDVWNPVEHKEIPGYLLFFCVFFNVLNYGFRSTTYFPSTKNIRDINRMFYLEAN